MTKEEMVKYLQDKEFDAWQAYKEDWKLFGYTDEWTERSRGEMVYSLFYIARTWD